MLKAARNNHVFGAAQQGDEALLVDTANIAHALPALAVVVVPAGLFGFLGLVLIARHHGGRAPHQLANLARR
jgi:hypothetical protein